MNDQTPPSVPTLKLTAAPPVADVDPVAEFAAQHIGDAETVTIRVVYTGHEGAPDELVVNRAGEVIEARSVDA